MMMMMMMMMKAMAVMMTFMLKGILDENYVVVVEVTDVDVFIWPEGASGPKAQYGPKTQYGPKAQLWGDPINE